MLAAINKFVKALNNSKLFAGIIMLLMNIGSRYIQVKLSKSQEAFMRNYVVREVLIFAVCWMANRDLYMSIMLTAAFFVLSEYMFNEDSAYCVLPKKYRQLHMVLDTNKDGEVSEKEIAEAIELLKKAKEQKLNKDQDRIYSYFTKKRG